VPTLPWTPVEAPPPGSDAVVLGSMLQLRSYRHFLSFLRAAMQVRRQVRTSPGAVGVSLIAQPTRKTFWTLSAWTDQDALDAFVRTAPHADVRQRFHDRLARHAFATWSLRASELPKPHSNAKETWRDARRRLDAELNDPKG
jgi:heme-degrading monooxygenase HmoA